MTISITELSLYFVALLILFLTPGPVWIAIIARTISGGAKSALSLTLGVSLGDMLWPIIVFFGLGFLISIYSDIFTLIRYLAALILSLMGLTIIWRANKGLETNEKLTGSGFFAGFLAGFLVIYSNPKASLFYLYLLPGFFYFDFLFFIKIHNSVYIFFLNHKSKVHFFSSFYQYILDLPV